MKHYRTIRGQTLKALRMEAKDRPRCKHCGYLLNREGVCWFCGKKARRR